MTDEELAFIRAATAQPEEDTCRLVYADWLEEQGGEKFTTQAAFVRLQVERCRLDLFDPERTLLLQQEAELARRYRRGWNGRVHKYLAGVGVREKVAACRGIIRLWEYYRGMIDRVTLSVDGLASHANLAISIGPIQCLAVSGWHITTANLRSNLSRLLPKVKALALIGVPSHTTLTDLARIEGLGLLPLLDLRSVDCGRWADDLLRLSREGRISPVVLFHRGVLTEHPARLSRDEVHVIDPFGHWDEHRRWYSNLNGTVFTPVVYRGGN